ncbi:phosphate acyltransferase PlsX [Natronogracilivirga saccharolytica]|uniref:Phosphate acyltransferase n=1 Tax=Natronogracilivirga saccharolytica TaxID=2812953 RepID=A0A8J7UVE9_9BACT|nr:phosphate acyltransferase PlsX [Natronogracilivirga saccharolytica]MBP3192482.1 phosphate acyltransferase PlsX [Natronogracilivirga saccharolytica]
MKIAVDAAGGDFQPENPVKGAIQAVNENAHISVCLVGPEAPVRKELEGLDYPEDRLTVHDAPEIIGMDESPAQAVKTKTRSSIVVGLGMHQKGMVNGFVSAGNTGALMAASAFILGRLDGIIRPTIATFFPTIKGQGLMIDAGANLEVKPEMLFQFGIMGKIFASDIMGIETPRVGLLNVGEEKEKGSETLKKAHQLLEALPSFVGNIEGRDILAGNADVFVCDGITGNILLKFGESIPEALQTLLFAAMKKNQIDGEQKKLVGGLLKEAFAPFDYQAVGGVPFLGVNGISMVGHGGSSPEAIKNMIVNAARMAEIDINKKIITSIA